MLELRRLERATFKAVANQVDHGGRGEEEACSEYLHTWACKAPRARLASAFQRDGRTLFGIATSECNLETGRSCHVPTDNRQQGNSSRGFQTQSE